MDAWVARMKQNHWIIPSYVGPGWEGRWSRGEVVGQRYGWGFSPVNPSMAVREIGIGFQAAPHRWLQQRARFRAKNQIRRLLAQP